MADVGIAKITALEHAAIGVKILPVIHDTALLYRTGDWDRVVLVPVLHQVSLEGEPFVQEPPFQEDDDHVFNSCRLTSKFHTCIPFR